MTFRAYIDVDGDAFTPDPGPELARILRTIVYRIESGERLTHYLTILDVNGNDVGRFAIKDDGEGSP